MLFILWLGLLVWGVVVLDFGISFRRSFRLMSGRHYPGRRSLRFVFLVMALGWPLWILRELHRLPRTLAAALLILGVASGGFAAFVLMRRWMDDPSVLD